MGIRTQRIITAIWFGLAALGGGAALAEGACDAGSVTLSGDWGSARFTIEIADDAAERMQGLMHRPSMARSAGMLFLYERPHRASFWMRNTLIPLDMIFINPEGIVTRIHANAIPHDETSIDGGEGVIAVLEINGGLAKAMGIAEGSRVSHPFFDPEQNYPCES
ncbi:DUF192 domain-containing protein [Alphaproteobacteria bacterium KMM 3653]|uniref:DUF192 domain-containing protein n=1 Tax=Harenicola maris TaxID=2841044 RepID=A0AAP2G2X1_9RHOB|nr:DUF192 domain-containing protein [Harenicola maris]